MFKSILVGIDGSDQSTKALITAAGMAQEYGADLHIFHAVSHHYEKNAILVSTLTAGDLDQQILSRDSIQQSYEEAGERILAQAKAILLKTGLYDGEHTRFHLEKGLSPAEFAIAFAAENRADLVVVGDTGHHSRFRQGPTGSVTSKILNEVPCEVLIVR